MPSSPFMDAQLEAENFTDRGWFGAHLICSITNASFTSSKALLIFRDTFSNLRKNPDVSHGTQNRTRWPGNRIDLSPAKPVMRVALDVQLKLVIGYLVKDLAAST